MKRTASERWRSPSWRRRREKRPPATDHRTSFGALRFGFRNGYAGLFSLATPVEEHPAGTLVQVTVPVPNPSRLVLDFSNHHQVRTDACVLLCGSIGALRLLELGYTGPLVTRPRLAACEGARLHGELPARP